MICKYKIHEMKQIETNGRFPRKQKKEKQRIEKGRWKYLSQLISVWPNDWNRGLFAFMASLKWIEQTRWAKQIKNALMTPRSRESNCNRRERWEAFRRGESGRETRRKAKKYVKTEVGRWVLKVLQSISWFSLKLIAWRGINLVGKRCFGFSFS